MRGDQVAQVVIEISRRGQVTLSVPRTVAFLDELGRGRPSYRYATEVDSRAALPFGLFGVPETFVLDRAGTAPATHYRPAFWTRSSRDASPATRAAPPSSPAPWRR
ncbi:hypothetical protein GCM10010464_75550 [Pseudonocardia yunnanensis]